MEAISKLFSDIINGISNENLKYKYEFDLDQVKSEVEYLTSNPEELKELILSKFKIQNFKDEDILSFFGCLGNHSYEIETLNRFGAFSMKNIFIVIGECRTEKILESLVQEKNRSIWGVKYLFPELLSIYKLKIDFVLKWFVDIHHKVNNYTMSSTFYNAISNYALAFPEEGEKIVKHYIQRPDDNSLKQIAALALGAIRVSFSRLGKHPIKEDLDHKLKNNFRSEIRELYLISLGTSYQYEEIELSEILRIIRVYENQTVEEQAAKCFLIYRIISKREHNLDQIQQLLNEISTILKITTADTVKYWVLEILNRLQSENNDHQINSTLLFLFEKILPFQIEQKGLWQLFEFLLIEMQSCNRSFIGLYIEKLLEKASNELLELLNNHHSDSIGHILKQSLDENIFGQMLLSNLPVRRKIVLLLIRKYNLKVHSLDIFNPTNEILGELLVDLIDELFLEKSSDLLLLVEPLYAKASDQVKNDFQELMFFQGMNLPESCYSKWKEIQAKSELLQLVCSNLETYFLNLTETANLFPEKFVYSPFADAATQKKIKDEREIYSMMKENSIFLREISQISILYSKQIAFFDAEGNDQHQNLKPIRHSFESPRMEFLDPEGIRIYRINLISRYMDRIMAEGC